MNNVKTIIELFNSAELAIPVFQIILLLLLSTIALLFGKIKLALILNYLFTFYWGYLFNKERLISTLYNKLDSFIYLYFYFGFGLVIFFLALVGLLSPQ